MFFVNYTESLAQVFRDSLAFGWVGKGIGWLATKVAFSPFSPLCPGPCPHTWATLWHPPTPPRTQHHTQTRRWLSWSSTWGGQTKREGPWLENVERRCTGEKHKKQHKLNSNENWQSGSRSASDTFHHVLNRFEAPTRLLPYTGSRTTPFSPNQTQTHTLWEPEMDPAQNNLVIAFNAIPAYFKGRAWLHITPLHKQSWTLRLNTPCDNSSC